MTIHVFWDNSNIFGRASGAAADLEPNVPWIALRVYWRNLFELVSQGRDAGVKVLAGAIPPACADLWPYAENLGFDVRLLRSAEVASGRLAEQGVDELLHLAMANTLLDHPGPDTMVLLSGDGSGSEGGSSFPSQLRRALERGWSVEVYAWESGFSHKGFDPLINDFPERCRVVFLEEYYDSTTFVKEGVYYLPHTGTEIALAGRVVRPLP